jgi:hypothetical protein
VDGGSLWGASLVTDQQRKEEIAGVLSLSIHETLDRVEMPQGSILKRVEALAEAYLDLLKKQEQAAKQADLERLLEEIGREPWDTMSLIGDCYLDRGEDGKGKGWHWLSTHHRWPHRWKGGWSWLCGQIATNDIKNAASDLLPHALYTVIFEELRKKLPLLDTLRAVVSAIADGRWKNDDPAPNASVPSIG